MEAIVYAILQMIVKHGDKIFVNSLPFTSWDVHFSAFSDTIL